MSLPWESPQDLVETFEAHRIKKTHGQKILGWQNIKTTQGWNSKYLGRKISIKGQK
jgi:hypothetical protein